MPPTRPAHITGRDPAGNPVLDYGYGFDEVGNITSKATEHGPYSYGYDALDRLTSADNPTLPDEAYTYDAVGNRLTDAKTEGQWGYSDSDELQGYGGVTLSYDANGSLTQKNANGTITQYGYNLANCLAEVRDGAGALIASYYYDPFGRRLWKEVGGTTTYFFYAEEGLIAEADASGAITRQYGWQPDGTWGTDPLYLKAGGQTYFYVNDHLGTPQALVGVNGAVVWAAKFEAFGVAYTDVGQVENPLRLPGQYHDAETGLHYNYFRTYDPSLGRYLESDPIGLAGGLNTFGYASQNPKLRSDPYGLITPQVVGGIVGLVVGASYSFFVNDNDWKTALYDGIQAGAAGFISGGGSVLIGFAASAGASAVRSKVQCGEVDVVSMIINGGFAIGGGYVGRFAGVLVPEKIVRVQRGFWGRFGERVGLLGPKLRDANEDIRILVETGVAASVENIAAGSYAGVQSGVCGCE